MSRALNTVQSPHPTLGPPRGESEAELRSCGDAGEAGQAGGGWVVGNEVKASRE